MSFTTLMEPKEAKIPAKKKSLGTFDPSRVKSSIPGANSSALQPYKQKKNKEKSAKYIEELKKVETVRAIKLEQEQEIT